MPVYVYECSSCKNRIELVQKVNERLAPICFNESCINNGKDMDSVLCAVGFILKGSGWAKDGYSGGGK